MSDLISRADAIEAVRYLIYDRQEKGAKPFKWWFIKQRLNAIPSADAYTEQQVRDAFNSGYSCGMEQTKEAQSADAVPQLKQTDTLIIADALRYLAQDTERYLPDRTRADALREHILQYGASMCSSADAVQGEWNTGKPTKGGKYIVTLIGIGDYRFVDIMHYDKPCMPNKEVSGACWYRDDDEWGDVVYDDKDIIAWIPLPKPYKGGDDE